MLQKRKSGLFFAHRINQTIIGGARTDIIPARSETYTSKSSE
jgi:hypothetical protein